TGSLQLLNECRDLMTDRLSQSLSVMLDKADDVLFDLAQKGGASGHPFYFNAMREMRLKRTSIEAGFKENFSDLFSKAIQVKNEGEDDTSSSNKSDIEEIDIEESLALTNTVGKIRHDCYDALFSLDQRMSELLGEMKVEKRQNPIRPETVCLAFQEACQDVESGIEVKLILFKLFEKYVAACLNNVYSDVDTLLTERQFSPQAKSGQGMHVQNQSPEDKNVLARQNTGIIKDKNYLIFANRVIRNEINEHIKDSSIPEFVRDFLFNHWIKLLLKIHIKEGVNSKAWEHAIDVIDDLVNCIGNLTSTTEKLNLVFLMPHLIQRLKYGMNVIPLSPAIREEFISELAQYHKKLFESMEEKAVCQDTWGSEDVTVPKFRAGASQTPFMDELLVDNKPGKETDNN
ncbi:MAG: DUF1631 family protein, partial [Gammaproteobacteria bacterium]|nr:DUF1631 family protein [Gammaproteobacteria bacterium]